MGNLQTKEHAIETRDMMLCMQNANYKENHNYKKMIEDDLLDNNEVGYYREIKYELKRLVYTHWCGYIYPEFKIKDNVVNMLENISHGGLTSGLGFDCAHIGDYPMFGNGTFRDRLYVLQIIHNIIDCVLENKDIANDDVDDLDDSDNSDDVDENNENVR